MRPYNSSVEVALAVGLNTINVVCTAQDGHSATTYVVQVTRESATQVRNIPPLSPSVVE